jgi:hypothetical protein
MKYIGLEGAAPFIEQNSSWRILLLNLAIVTLWKPRDVAIADICVRPGVPIQDSQTVHLGGKPKHARTLPKALAKQAPTLDLDQHARRPKFAVVCCNRGRKKL